MRRLSSLFVFLVFVSSLVGLPAWAGTPSVSLALSGDYGNTLTATVSDGNGGPAHAIVTFCDVSRPHCEDLAILGKVATKPDHTASLTLRLSGKHAIKAFALGVSSPVVNLDFDGNVVTAVNAFTQPYENMPGAYILNTKVFSSTTTPPSGQVNADFQSSFSVLAKFPVGSPSVGLADDPVIFPSFPNSNLVHTNPDYGPPAVGDLNNDGYPDILMPDTGNYLDVVLSGGVLLFPGGLLTPQDPAHTPLPAGVVGRFPMEADFNGDGNLDVLLQVGTSQYLVLLGKGDGTFQQPGPLISTPGDVAIQKTVIADFDEDGIFDILYFGGGQVTLLHGVGDGTFTPSTSVSLSGGEIDMATADINGDGHADLVLLSAPGPTPGSIAVLFGNGDGTFKPAVKTTLLCLDAECAKGALPNNLLVGDLNGDGIPDVAVAEQYSSSLDADMITVLLGAGDGTFNRIPPSAESILGYGPAVLGDFNGDGVLDIAYGGGTLLGNGDGSFKGGPSAGSSGSSFAARDLNGTGTTALIGNFYFLTADYFYQSTASGVYSPLYVPGIGNYTVPVAYQGDSAHPPAEQDLVLAGDSILLPTTLALTSFPGPTPVSPITLFAVLTSNPYIDGGPNTTEGELISFTQGDTNLGSAPLAGDAIGFNAAAIATTQITAQGGPVKAVYPGDQLYASSSATVQVSVPSGQNNPEFKGNYAFLVSGSISGNASVPPGASSTVTAIGSIVADGQGNIVDGIEEVNTPVLDVLNHVTGTYSVGPDNRGYLTLHTPGNPDQTFALVVEPPTGGGLSSRASLVALTIAVGHGTLVAQTPTSAITPGSYALTLSGETACLVNCRAGYPGATGGAVAINGVINVAADGSLAGTATLNVIYQILVDHPFSGAYQPVDQYGSFTFTLPASGSPNLLPSSFRAVVLDANHFFLMSTDSHRDFALLSGEAER